MSPEQEKEYKSKISGFFEQIEAAQKEFSLTDLEASSIFISELEKLVESFKIQAKELKQKG